MSVSIVEWLLNFGVAGLVILLLATGVLVPGYIYKDLMQANEKLNDALSIERQRNQDLQQMAVTGAKAFTALADVAEEHRMRAEYQAHYPYSYAPPAPPPAGAAPASAPGA